MDQQVAKYMFACVAMALLGAMWAMSIYTGVNGTFRALIMSTIFGILTWVTGVEYGKKSGGST